MKLTVIILAACIAVAMCQIHQCDHHNACTGHCPHHTLAQCIQHVCVCTNPVVPNADVTCTTDANCAGFDCSHHHQNHVAYCNIAQHNHHQGHCDCRPNN